MDRRSRPSRRGGGILLVFLILLVCVVMVQDMAGRLTAASDGHGEGLEPSAARREGSAVIQRAGERAAAAEPQPEPEPTALPGSKTGHEDWTLTLVNAQNPLPDAYAPPLKALSNGLQFDERAIDRLNAMLSAAREQGLSPVVCSAYRTAGKQQALFDQKVSVLTASGLSIDQADAEARRHVAYPGTSEHSLGLAADIVSLAYQSLDDHQAFTPEVLWLHEHCWEYGFILRYPEGKEEITGVTYESWHFRYVGVQAAKEIMDSGLCLEEYLAG